MTLEQIADKVIEADVLVVGGAIAGCAAAAKATEHGLKVTLVEKAKTERSGASGPGIDKYGGAFPRGMTPKEFVAILEELGGRDTALYGAEPWYSDPTRMYRQYANGQWAIEELEKLGVDMRWDDGEFRSVFKGREAGPFIRVHWMNAKPEMAAGVRKRGVNILERTMVVDLLTNNGAVVGATAVNTRTGEFIVIKAKATVIATGMFGRCYNPNQPVPGKYKFRYHVCPAVLSGDGWAMAYRAGAELTNMEQTGRKRSFRDDLTCSMGNASNEGVSARALTWDGDQLQQYRIGMAELEQKGKDPFYYSFEHLPDDFHKRIELCFLDERMISLKISEDRGFNLKTHWFEIIDSRPTVFQAPPGMNADSDFSATVKGLYAAGDCVAGSHDVANAATAGFLVGDSIHNFVNKVREPVIDEAQVESQKEAALAPLAVKDGTEPMELECAIRYICTRYAGVNRAEGKLREGLRRLGTLRRVFLPKLIAKNPHYLMRCLEVRNIMDLAEVHMQASLERKETRGQHIRLDYPGPDRAWDGMLTYQRLEKEKPVFEMRKRPPLNMELREER